MKHVSEVLEEILLQWKKTKQNSKHVDALLAIAQKAKQQHGRPLHD